MGNGLLQLGGEGYGILNRWIIGGSGHFSSGDQQSDNGEEYYLRGGGGYFHLGYVLYDGAELLAFPLLGFGADALGINRSVSGDIRFEPDRFLEVTYFTLTTAVDLGVGMDWFPGKKGFKLGVRAGYNLSLSADNTWRHYEGELTDSDLPDNDLDGFYLRLTIGGGHFGFK